MGKKKDAIFYLGTEKEIYLDILLKFIDTIKH